MESPRRRDSGCSCAGTTIRQGSGPVEPRKECQGRQRCCRRLHSMATLGSPPAGWYTDPSGQHRARYWDGGGWTEQVRDDVGAPSAVAGGERTHEVAATVAGIAQAVATVAEQDVTEPPFVVDYGTPEPAPYGVTETPVDPGFGALTATAAVDSGPVPGWYPDPSMRHQARFWDGFKWTERVADHGNEGIDPVPGTAVVQAADYGAAATDPMDGWSTQLLGDTDDGGFPPVAAAEPQVSAGQASLAMLGEREDVDEDEPRVRERERPTGKVVVAGWMVVGGALALLLGSTRPWMHVRGRRVSYSATTTGMSLGDGRITVALAILLAVLAGAILTGRMQRIGGAKVAAMGVLVAGAAVVAVTAVDIADVADRATRLGVPSGAVTSVGSGLWLCFLGGLLAVGGGLLAFANRNRAVRI